MEVDRRLTAIERRLAWLRGALPEAEEMARFVAGCFDSERAREIAGEVDALGGCYSPIVDAVAELPVAADGVALRGAVCACLAALVEEDARQYKQALGGLVALLPAVEFGEALVYAGEALGVSYTTVAEVAPGLESAVLDETEPEPAAEPVAAAEHVGGAEVVAAEPKPWEVKEAAEKAARRRRSPDLFPWHPWNPWQGR